MHKSHFNETSLGGSILHHLPCCQKKPTLLLSTQCWKHSLFYFNELLTSDSDHQWLDMGDNALTDVLHCLYLGKVFRTVKWYSILLQLLLSSIFVFFPLLWLFANTIIWLFAKEIKNITIFLSLYIATVQKTTNAILIQTSFFKISFCPFLINVYL